MSDPSHIHIDADGTKHRVTVLNRSGSFAYIEFADGRTATVRQASLRTPRPPRPSPPGTPPAPTAKAPRFIDTPEPYRSPKMDEK